MPEKTKVRQTHHTHCQDCSLAALCLPISLNFVYFDALN